MASASVSDLIPAPIEKVWEVVGDFNGMGKYVSAVTDSQMTGEGVGAVRKVTMQDGTVIEESLESYDPAAYELSYAIIAAPLPVKDYLATMKLTPTDGGCTLTWSSTYEPDGSKPADKTDKLVKLNYSFGIKGIKKLFS